ncbi:hypothetical protein PO909_023262 [Leuciscus waleckii]
MTKRVQNHESTIADWVLNKLQLPLKYSQLVSVYNNQTKQDRRSRANSRSGVRTSAFVLSPPMATQQSMFNGQLKCKSALWGEGELNLPCCKGKWRCAYVCVGWYRARLKEDK